MADLADIFDVRMCRALTVMATHPAAVGEVVVDYRGTYHRVDRAAHAPCHPGGTIPVWFGGGAETSLRRAARLHEILAEEGRTRSTTSVRIRMS